MFIFHKVSGSMLMGFGSHFGTLISMDWNSDSSAFIHSRFHYRFLINLSFTSIMVSKSLKFISFFTSRCLKFFYFFGEGFLELVNSSRAPSFKRFWDHNFFLVGSWIPGVLTNYKLVKSKLEKIRRHTNLFQYPSGFIFLGEARFLPISSAEARISKLPSIGISDVDTGFFLFLYTIPSNNKTFAVSVAYYYLF